jgi:hypothetical protein
MVNNETVHVRRSINIETKYRLRQVDIESSLAAGFRGAGYHNFDDVNDADIQVDLSRTFWYDVDAAVWLLVALHALRRRGNELHLVFPEPVDDKSRKAWSFLLRWRFFSVLRDFVDDPATLLAQRQLPYLIQRSHYAAGEGALEDGSRVTLQSDRLLEITPITLGSKSPNARRGDGAHGAREGNPLILALTMRCGWTIVEAKNFVSQVVEEALRNCEHGVARFALIAMRMDAQWLTFAVVDDGNGIPATLRSAFADAELRKKVESRTDADLIRYFADPEFIVDSEWIQLSVRAGVGSDVARPGLGLHYLKSYVLNKGGSLRIRSGCGSVDFGKEEVKADERDFCAPGTLLRVRLPLAPT